MGPIESAPERLGTFFDEELWPPDWSVLEAEEWADGSLHKPNGEMCKESYEIFCSKAWIGMEITIKMAFVSTLIGFIISVPIASLSANNLVPLPVAIPARFCLQDLEVYKHHLGSSICDRPWLWSIARYLSDDFVHGWLSRRSYSMKQLKE